jgi:putative copper export protein
VPGDHVVDGALAHAASFVGLAATTAPCTWWLATHSRLGAAARGPLRTTGAGLLAAGVILHLVAGAAVIPGPAGTAVVVLLTQTLYGRSLLGYLAFAGALVWCGARDSRGGAALTGGLAAGSAYGLALLGHAASDGDISVATAVTTVHVLAGITWLGGLLAAAIAEERVPAGAALAIPAGAVPPIAGAATRAAPGVLGRFGPVAAVSVGIAGVTGGVRAAALIAGGRERLEAGSVAWAWVGALVLKLAAFGLVLAVASRVRAAVRNPTPLRDRLGRLVELEIAALGVVVLLAGLLGRLPPP